MFDDLIPRASQPSGGLAFDDLIPSQAMQAPLPMPRPSDAEIYARDIAGGAGAGLVQGAAGVLGLPEDLRRLASMGLDQTAGRVLNRVTRGDWGPTNSADGPIRLGRSSADITRTIEDVATGPLYEAQTIPGQLAQTTARNAPVAAMTPGTAMQRAAMAAVPAIAEEAAGYATSGTPVEPYARAGAGLAAGIGTAAMMRPNYADRRIGQAVQGVTDEQAARAQALMRDAEARGIAVTPAEALQAVTNGGTGLAAVQRHVENLPGGAPIMGQFMAQRGPQVAQAVSGQLDEIAAAGARPQVATAQARDAAADIVSGTRRAINEQTRPLYDAAAMARVLPEDMTALTAHPSYARAMQAVRANPELSRFVGGLPDDSVAVVDKVKQILSQEASRVGGPMSQAAFGPTRAAAMEEAAGMARQAGVNVSDDYARALAEQERLRRGVLEPVQLGPLGRAAEAQPGRPVLDALIPPQPLPNAAAETEAAFRALAARDALMGQAGSPTNVARQMARMGLEDEWNAIQRGGGRVESTASQFRGADLAKVLRGDRGEVMEGAIRGAAGDQVAERTRRLAEILAATGERAPAGSLTAYNAQAIREAERGGLGGVIASAGKPLQTAKDVVQQARTAQYAETLARLLATGKSETLTDILQTGRRVSSANRDMLARILASFGGAAQPALAEPVGN